MVLSANGCSLNGMRCYGCRGNMTILKQNVPSIYFLWLFFSLVLWVSWSLSQLSKYLKITQRSTDIFGKSFFFFFVHYTVWVL